MKSERLNLIDWEAGFGLPGQSGKLALTIKSGKLASARLEVYLNDNFEQFEPLDGLWNIGARRALRFVQFKPTTLWKDLEGKRW